MKLKGIASAVLAGALLSSPAMAQKLDVTRSAVFNGPFVQTGLVVGSGRTELSSGASSIDDSQTFVSGSIGAGFSHRIGSVFNLAGGFQYVIGDQKAGTYAGTVGGTAVTVALKASDTYLFTIEPGGYVMDDLLVYGKAGYVHSDGFAEGTIGGTTVTSNKINLDGFVIGGGAKYHITSGLYATAEALYLGFNDKSSGSVKLEESEVISLLGIGYSFSF